MATPMNRRHFLDHLAGAAAFGAASFALGRTVEAAASQLARDHKSCILLWMSGGPPTIDIWDLKPRAATGGTCPRPGMAGRSTARASPASSRGGG